MAEGFMNQVVLDGTAQCGSHEEQTGRLGPIPHLGEAEFCRRVHSGSSRLSFDEGRPDPGLARGL